MGHERQSNGRGQTIAAWVAVIVVVLGGAVTATVAWGRLDTEVNHLKAQTTDTAKIQLQDGRDLTGMKTAVKDIRKDIQRLTTSVDKMLDEMRRQGRHRYRHRRPAPGGTP